MKKILFTLSALILVASCIAQTKTEVDKSFENITEVDVNVVCSDIFIEAVEGDVAHVKGSLSWNNEKDEYKIIAEQVGTKLLVEVKYPKRSKGNVEGHFMITLPKMTDADVNTVSGNIKVEGIGQRTVKCNTVSGDIEAISIQSNISCNTVSGDIEMTKIKGNAKSNTVSGDTELASVDGNFKGNSVSGDFSITNLKGNKEINTLSGTVR